MQTINVFYVTTPHEAGRYEIGKFFSAEAAHGFIASMQIKEWRVEKREEKAHEQHEAHEATVMANVLLPMTAVERAAARVRTGRS